MSRPMRTRHTPSTGIEHLPMVEIPLDDLRPTQPEPPPEAAIIDLRVSITTLCLLTPLIVTPDHRILAGHRRFMAIRDDPVLSSRYSTVPCLICSADEPTAEAIALADNLCRRTLSRSEMIASIYRLHSERGWSARQIGRSIGRSASDVAELLRIAKDAEVASLVAGDLIAPSTAGVLLRLDSEPRQYAIREIHAGTVRTIADLRRSVAHSIAAPPDEVLITTERVTTAHQPEPRAESKDSAARLAETRCGAEDAAAPGDWYGDLNPGSGLPEEVEEQLVRFQSALHGSGGKRAMNYLGQHGIRVDTVWAWGIGFVTEPEPLILEHGFPPVTVQLPKGIVVPGRSPDGRLRSVYCMPPAKTPTVMCIAGDPNLPFGQFRSSRCAVVASDILDGLRLWQRRRGTWDCLLFPDAAAWRSVAARYEHLLVHQPTGHNGWLWMVRGESISSPFTPDSPVWTASAASALASVLGGEGEAVNDVT